MGVPDMGVDLGYIYAKYPPKTLNKLSTYGKFFYIQGTGTRDKSDTKRQPWGDAKIRIPKYANAQCAHFVAEA